MRKNLITFLVLGIAFFAGHINPVFAQTLYSDSMGRYSFTLPSGWKEIPKSVIDQRIDEFIRQTQGQRIEYVAGFQLSEKDYFQYPYILIQEHDVNAPSYSQIKKIFSDSDFQSSVKQKVDEYSELMTGVTFGKPFFDRERNIVFVNTQIDVANIGKINGLTAMFLGNQGIIQINFYSLSNEYSRWLPVFNSVIDSFRYDAAYAYNPTEVVNNNLPSLFADAIAGGLSLIIIVLLVKAIIWGLRKKKDNNLSQ